MQFTQLNEFMEDIDFDEALPAIIPTMVTRDSNICSKKGKLIIAVNEKKNGSLQAQYFLN